MIRVATFSRCGLYRYHLLRRWGEGAPLLFIMLNPSTADGEQDDPTMRRCIHFAQAHGFGAMEVVNLFAYRATEPQELRRSGYPVGPLNDEHTALALQAASTVCLAWGTQAHGHRRIREVLGLVQASHLPPQCLAVTSHGEPHHPLTARRDSRLGAYVPSGSALSAQ